MDRNQQANQQANSAFPLCQIQGAYVIGEQATLPLSTTAQSYREIEIEAFDANTVEQAWHTLVMRHPMLRAVALADGRQLILDQVTPYQLVCHDLYGLDAVDRTARYEVIRNEVIRMHLPLDQWPQFCVQSSRNGNRLRLHIRFNLWMIDAVSINIVLSELLALCRSPAVALPALPATFCQYVEATVIEGSPGQLYWHERVPILPLGPELPLSTTDACGKPVFVHLAHVIAADEWGNFSDHAQQHGLTPDTAVLAVYAMVLARWSKRGHFTITLMLSQRPFAGKEMADIVGNFETTILLEIDTTKDQSFVEFASTIQQQLSADIRHRDVSGIEVGREVNRVQGTPLGMVAPVTFSAIQGKSESSESSNSSKSSKSSAARAQVLKQTFQHAIHLELPQNYLDHQMVEEPQGHVTLHWNFVDGLWQDNVAEDMFTSYTACLHTLAAEIGLWSEHKPMLLPESHRQVLAQYNQTDVVSRDCTLDQLVTEQIAACPNRIALINGIATLTYAELGQRINDARRRLAHIAITPGRLIGVVFPKGWQQIVAVLAISQSGGAYVPIDPDLPPSRRRQLIEQANISVVLTSRALASQLDLPPGVESICIDGIAPPSVTTLSGSTHTPDDIAYVIFTSGSTGVPKGVVINHRGAVNTILDINRRLGTRAADKVLALSSLSFDLSVFEIFGLLGAGGTVLIPTTAEQQAPETWARLIAQHGISIWNSVPAIFQLLTDSCAQDKVTLPSLKQVLLSGDWIPRNLPEQGRAIATNARIFSLGGATEASIWSVIYETGTEDDSWRSIPYGRPLANQQLYVFDHDLQPCPLWKSGELYIGGRGLALSYLHDPVRSSERFITHPQTGQKLYRTGDMARMRPDGNMEFLGREDHQIKIRGFRIEPGEIESFILQQPSVLATIVKVVGTDHANKRLAAFVVQKPDAVLTAEALRDTLGHILPRYMVPELIHILASLPLTSNGKIDHQRLDALCVQSLCVEPPAQTHASKPDAAPEDDLAQALRQIWKEVLAQSDIDPDLSFFALGGTSFRGLQLVAKVRKQFGVRLVLADIGTDLSLRSMAAQLRQRYAGHRDQRTSGKLALLNLRPDLRPDDAAAKTGPTLFCIHPVGGSAHCYMPLAAHVAPVARIFGVQAARTATTRSGVTVGIDDLAEQYVALILGAEPVGPYLLLGWSMGAAITWEVGRRLLAKGKNVIFMGLLDPYCAAHSETPIKPITHVEILLSFCDDLAGLSGLSFNRPTATRMEALRNMAPDLLFTQLIKDMVRQAILPPTAPMEELREVFQIFERNTQALLAYTPEAINAEVTVFYAQTNLYAAERYLKQWRPVASKLREHQTVADHFTMMQAPAIVEIAGVINRQLARYQPTV
ncbi:non-ribosomal peptide synthetase [Glaciimonas sp. GG7]